VSIFRNPKDKILEIQTLEVYEIPCSCGGYIGQTRRVIEVWLKEHENYVNYRRMRKSIVGKHVKQEEHYIDFFSQIKTKKKIRKTND